MPENMGRIFGACAALAGLWILVYWWWQPAEPRIRFDDQRADSAAVSGLGSPARTTGRPGAAAGTETPQIAVIPPTFREYTVRPGDTLSAIALRELGSAAHADAISRSNPYIVFDQIRAGRVILIPNDPGNIQGLPIAAAEPPPNFAAATANAPPEEPSGPIAGEADVIEYTVKAGDSLTLIARKHYGSIRYKDLIFEANRDRLASEDQLQLGQKLRLPPKPD